MLIINARHCTIFAVLLAAAVALVRYADASYVSQVAVWASINSVLAVSMRLVLLIGETNMACGAIYGVSAYLTGIAVTHGMDMVPIVMVIAATLACFVGFCFGWVTLKVKGPYFMLIGFAFTEVVRLGATRIDYIGGNSGMVGIYAPQSIDPWMPALCVATCYLVVLGLYLLERSSFGLLLKATRNNEKVVESVGLSTLHIKLACFCTAAFAIGVAGSIHAYSYHVISPGDFGFLVPVYALAYVKVGGERHVLGAVIGACFLTVVAQMVQGTGSLQYIIFGGVIVITMLGLKGGILQLLSYALGLKKRRKRRNNADVLGEHAQGELR